MEIQILNYSSIYKKDYSFRLDAEHYQKKYLINQRKLSDLGSTPLSELISCPVITGHTPSMKNESYYGGKIKFIKTNNLREFKVSKNFTHYLSDSGNKKIQKSSLKPGDLIITIIGATHKIVGRACLIYEKYLPANINQNIALIRLKKEYSPEFLSVYLNSKIGNLALLYLSRQTEQVNLNCREVEKTLVPKMSSKFVNAISVVYKNSIFYENKSQKKYKQSQDLLLDELGLNNWQPKHQLSFIKKYSNVQQAERIDAEYYQPKYDALVKAIKNYSGGWDILGNIVYIKKGFEVGSAEYLDEGIPFVRVSNINTFEITEEKYISEVLYNKLTSKKNSANDFTKSSNHQPQQGEILLTKDGTLGTAYYLREKPKKMIVASGILRLKNKTDSINNEYLTTVINSILVQEQAMRDMGGTVILHWRPEQIQGVVIPILSQEKQAQIQQKVTESFKLRQQSNQLLEFAKQAVEMAIEQDE